MCTWFILLLYFVSLYLGEARFLSWVSVVGPGRTGWERSRWCVCPIEVSVLYLGLGDEARNGSCDAELPFLMGNGHFPHRCCCYLHSYTVMFDPFHDKFMPRFLYFPSMFPQHFDQRPNFRCPVDCLVH